MVEIAQAQPAIGFVHGQSVQAQRAHFGPQFARETVFGIDRRGDRRDAFVGKARDRIAQHQGLFGQAEIEFGGRAHHILFTGYAGNLADAAISRKLKMGASSYRFHL